MQYIKERGGKGKSRKESKTSCFLYSIAYRVHFHLWRQLRDHHRQRILTHLRRGVYLPTCANCPATLLRSILLSHLKTICSSGTLQYAVHRVQTLRVEFTTGASFFPATILSSRQISYSWRYVVLLAFDAHFNIRFRYRFPDFLLCQKLLQLTNMRAAKWTIWCWKEKNLD